MLNYMKQLLTLLLILFVKGIFAQTGIVDVMTSARQAFESKNYSEALKLYNQAVNTDKTNTEALFWRGRSKVELKDIQGAKLDFENVLQLSPTHFGTLINLGNVNSILKDYRSALDYYNRAEEINAADIAVHENKGRILYNMQNFESAIPAFTKAISIDSSDKDLYRFRSDCYNYTGKMDLAKADLEHILRMDSNDIPAKTNLAFCYITNKEFSKANYLYEKLYQIKKSDPYILSNYGYVTHILGKTIEGLELINRSLKLYPGNAYAYKYLAEIYLSSKNIDDACKAINTGIKLGFTASYGRELEHLRKLHCH